MKINVPKDWLLEKSKLEEGQEIGAGNPHFMEEITTPEPSKTLRIDAVTACVREIQSKAASEEGLLSNGGLEEIIYRYFDLISNAELQGANAHLESIAENLCGIKVGSRQDPDSEDKLTVSDVYAFVEGAICNQESLKDNAIKNRDELSAILFDVCNAIGFRPDYEKLPQIIGEARKERETLMLRSVRAMVIAEGEDTENKIPIDCPMLEAVKKWPMNATPSAPRWRNRIHIWITCQIVSGCT